MLSYDELLNKSKSLNQLIDENLEQQKILQTKESFCKSNLEYQRHACIRKLREKLNLVITSRNKANESNKRILSDFDRIQKHLALMDSKTEVLMNNVNNQKRYLDIHYPKWRERANIYMSPSYLNQENIFNLLDSLRCRLKDDENTSFRTFTKTDYQFDTNTSLVSLLQTGKACLKKTAGDAIDLVDKDDIQMIDSTEVNSKSKETKRPNVLHFPLDHGKNSSFTKIYSSLETTDNDEGNPLPVCEKAPILDTLTSITVSPDVSLNLKCLDTNNNQIEDDDDKYSSDITLSPKHSQETSLHSKITSPEPNSLSFVKPNPTTNVSAYNFKSTALDNINISDSNDDIENILSPQKSSKPQSPKLNTPLREDASPAPSESFARLSPRIRNASIDSPGGSVDTIIKSPIPIYKNKKPVPKLSALTSQISIDSESESSSAFKPPVTLQQSKRKTALDLLNDSSESEVMLNNDKIDSEDDFDFFD